ncbi:flavin reductase family protein [Streptomyces sp. EN16]|uniref:flavin reductase family protein n=1 Tax=Streptomyces sp. EN16 TaxID=212773 RepID=UPI0008516F8A|nr:flavin reductase family protein [Streptomyces sp. EN16]
MTQTTTPSVTPAAMRRTLAGFATGLSVVAAEIDGRLVGMPVNSLVSVSLDPPMVSLAFADTSTTWPVLRRAPHWGISVLGEAQAQVLQDLRRPAAERFGGIEMRIDDGAAFVQGALATIAVTPRTAVAAGDHTLVLLEVEDLRRDESQRPLVFFDSSSHTLSR